MGQTGEGKVVRRVGSRLLAFPLVGNTPMYWVVLDLKRMKVCTCDMLSDIGSSARAVVEGLYVEAKSTPTTQKTDVCDDNTTWTRRQRRSLSPKHGSLLQKCLYS